MNHLKLIFTSRTRIAVLIMDIFSIVVCTLICALATEGLTFETLSTVMIHTVLCIPLFFVTQTYKYVDTTLFTLSRASLSVVISAVITATISISLLELPISTLPAFAVSVTASIIAIFFIRAMYIYYSAEYRQALRRSMKKSALVVGAGVAASILLRELEGDSSPYYANCMVDDDPKKYDLHINGVPVVGVVADIPRIAKERNIDTIIIAIPSASQERMAEIAALCSSTDCFVKTLPSISKILEQGGEFLKSITNIKMEDLLGREPISIDTDTVRSMVSGKVCMVTGGGGSIGSELCRQIMQYHPKKLIIVDIYENNAYDIQQELIRKYGKDIPLLVYIASVRDEAKMELLFDKLRPELVFHAAAHKHVPLMEYSAEEAIKNNVFGTFTLANLAIKYKTARFLLISTDKAVNPTNVMGASKRCCEKVIKHFSNMDTDTIFVTVRFGNVLGSNGSVVPLFEKQIENGGPITITHPDITRYFMTIPEAVALVLQAETMAQNGQIFVLDMGKPVKIVTLAENLIKKYGYVPYKDIQIKFVGLREGEKLYEELRLDDEEIIPTYNKKIFIGSHIELEEDFLEKLKKLRERAEANDSEGVVEMLCDIVPTYSPDTRIHK